MLQDDLFEEHDAEHAFGALLTTLRSRARGKKVKQKDIVAGLAGWTVSSYSRLENGELAPRFDQLLPLYRAFRQVGIAFTPDARQQLVDLARKRIAVQKTHKDIHSDAEWAQLRFELARLDGLQDTSSDRSSLASRPLLTETSHLVGREAWRNELVGLLSGPQSKKLVVVCGPAGMGKSSELNWLATYFFRQKSPICHVILCDFRAEERPLTHEEALEVVLSTMLAELRCPLTGLSHRSLEERTLLLLNQLEQARQPIVVLVDHSECLLTGNGWLASCWERFFSRFLRSQHQATLILATKQWPGWYGGEHRFVVEHSLPSLPLDEGILLLQQLGLDTVPVQVLQEVYDKVGGIPLCLEWMAALVKQPLHADDWEEFDARGQETGPSSDAKIRNLVRTVQQLLAEPHIFGGNLADAIAPVLDRIIANQCLSDDARRLLHVLSVAFVPLAKPALASLCSSGPRPLDELRRASLLVAYPNRARLLPMVASAILRHLSPEEVEVHERLLIQAYTAWLAEGTFYERESGATVAELATLLLKHHRLLEVAQLFLRYGWLAFNQGHASRLARLAMSVVECTDRVPTEEDECGGLLLQDFLSPFVGKTIDASRKLEDYQRVYDAVLAGKITLQSPIEVAITYHLMVCAMNELRFEEARSLLDVCCDRLRPLQESSVDLQASLLEKRAWLLGRWSEYLEEQGEAQRSRELQEQAISIYRQSIALLSASEERSPSRRVF